MEFSNENISTFLKGLLEVGGVHKVEDTPDKYVRNVLSGKIEELPIEAGSRKLAIFGTMANDVIIVNPFAEGESNTTRTTWFYHDRNIAISALLAKAMEHVLTVAARSHNKKAKEEANDQKVIKFVGKYAVNVDNKMVTEFKQVRKNLAEFATIYYNKKKRFSTLNCVLFNEGTPKIHPSVRAGSWDVLKAIFLKVVNVKSLDEFKIEPQNPDMPVFESFCYVFLNVLDNIKPVLELAGVSVDTEELKGHLKYLSMYQQRAKWCASTAQVVPQAQKLEEQKKTTPAVPTGLMNNNVPWAPARSLPTGLRGASMMPPQPSVPMPVPQVQPMVPAVPAVQPMVPAQPMMSSMQPAPMVSYQPMNLPTGLTRPAYGAPQMAMPCAGSCNLPTGLMRHY